jgi:hypothetical protein
MTMLMAYQLLAACTPTETIKQTVSTPPEINPYEAIIRSSNCSLPCWYGIEANKTSFKDAREILIEKYGVENIESFKENNISWETNSGNIHQGIISFYNGVTSEILVTFNNNGNFTVANIIEILDSPAWIFVGSQPDYHCMGLRMEYPSMGVYVYLDIASETKSIEPSSAVFMLIVNEAIQSEQMQVYDGNLVKWDGYGEYCKKNKEAAYLIQKKVDAAASTFYFSLSLQLTSSDPSKIHHRCS